MMCKYCGTKIQDEPIELQHNENTIHLCDEECAIFFYQEQQQRNFQSWVKIR